MDIWKPISFTNGDYEVSNQGQVRHGQRILVPSLVGRDRKKPNGGYASIKIHGRRYLIHVLMAEAFIGPKPVGHQVNHKDGIKLNLVDTNLEYRTPSGNTKHAYEMGLISRRKALSSEQETKVVEMFDTGVFLVRDLAELFKVHKTTIHRVLQEAGRSLTGAKKVTEAMKDDIRSRYIPYRVSMAFLATEHGLSENTVRSIIADDPVGSGLYRLRDEVEMEVVTDDR